MMSKEFGLYPRSGEESLKSFNLHSDTFIFVLQKIQGKEQLKTIVEIHFRK